MKNTTKIIFLAIIFLGIFGLAQSSEAKVINVVNTSGQPSCEQVDVQRVINDTGTADGDTVFVPAGSCTWSTTTQGEPSVLINKSITLQGAGSENTIITDGTDYDKGAGKDSEVALRVTEDEGKTIRITGFTFVANQLTENFVSMITIGKKNTNFWKGLRIDHCSFNTKYQAITILPGVYGLIDHCTFTYFQGGAIAIVLHGWGEPSGDSLSFSQPNPAGTDNALYVEDCTFGTTGRQDWLIDGYNGANYVVRHNTIVNGVASNHDTAYENKRGMRHWEFYNNTFSIDNVGSITNAINMRVGTGMIFGNTFSNNGTDHWDWCVHLINYRSGVARNGMDTHWGYCDGTNDCDGNNAVTDGSGTHSGGNDEAILTDGTKSWVASDFIDWQLYNITDGSRCKIIANTANTVTCTLIGGTDNNWDTGDSYKITNGYPCMDQIGRITDSGPGSAAGCFYTAPGPGPTQALEPLYAWNNKCKSETYNAVVKVDGACYNGICSKDHIKANRDFYDYVSSFDGTVGAGSGTGANRPATCTTGVGYWATDEGEWDSTHAGNDGRLYRCTATDTWTLAYTPYTYPHPLTLNDDHISPSAPTGVVIE